MNSHRPPISKGTREFVFARSNGVCQRCAQKIDLDTFHCSHIRSYAHGGISDPSNLEAWCPLCNLTNGAADAGDPRLQPREWQKQALNRIAERIARSGAATLVAAPGAGKTLFASFVFEALHAADLIDRLLIFVPRRSLMNQWETALAKQRHIQIKPDSPIERQGQHGVVMTYQSLGSRDVLDAHLLQVAAKRTLLVLDEVHHLGELADGSLPAWARNMRQLAGDVEAEDLGVTGILNLSGTLWRSDDSQRISTVRYSMVDNNRLESQRDFEVKVDELVARGELRPIDIYRLNARVSLADYQELRVVESDLSDLDEKQARGAMAGLGTIAEWRTDFVDAVLNRLERVHRDLDDYPAKALIVANRQEEAIAFAGEVNEQMRRRGLRPLAELAISDIGKDAQIALERFRIQKTPGVLCTVDMAGEGYDCPDIAVIGYASNKLTPLYVRQVIARAMRVTDREREMGDIIPAAIVVPDIEPLIQQLITYLAPFTYEVLKPDDLESREERERRERMEERVQMSLTRFKLEEAHMKSELITVSYSDGSVEDIEAKISDRLARQLQTVGIKESYAPRIIAASRRAIRDEYDTSPFDRPGADTAVLEQLTRGRESLDRTEPSQTELLTIERQAEHFRQRIKRWVGWWAKFGDTQAFPIVMLQSCINDYAGIQSGGRESASIEQLSSGMKFVRDVIKEYCARTGRKAPRDIEE